MDSSSENREAQQEAILKSAKKVFAKYGFRKTTVEDVANGAGLRKASVYYYYKSKEEIFSAVVKRESAELLEAMQNAAAKEKTTNGKLRVFFLTRYDLFRKKKNLFEASQETLNEIRPLVVNARDEYVEKEIEVLSSLLEMGIESGEFDIRNPKLLSLVAIASLQGIDNTFWKIGKEDEIEAGLNLMMDIFFRGVSKGTTK